MLVDSLETQPGPTPPSPTLKGYFASTDNGQGDKHFLFYQQDINMDMEEQPHEAEEDYYYDTELHQESTFCHPHHCSLPRPKAARLKILINFSSFWALLGLQRHLSITKMIRFMDLEQANFFLFDSKRKICGY